MGEPRAGSWKLPLAALAVGVGVGAGLVALSRGSPAVAMLAPGSDAHLTAADGRPIAPGPGGALAPGDHVHSGAQPAQVTVGARAHITLQPHGELTVSADADAARLDRGVAVVETQATIEQVRIATAAGDLVLTKAVVEVRAAADLPSARGKGPRAVAYVRVEQGSVRLEAADRSLTLDRGEQGLLESGRPPWRPTDEPPPIAADAPDAGAAALLAEDQEPPPEALPDWAPVFAPPVETQVVTPVAVPVPIPVAVAGGGDGGSIGGFVEIQGAPPAGTTTAPACGATGAPVWAVNHGRVANVYVHISAGLPASAAWPVPPQVNLSQRGCAFDTRTVALIVGQRLRIGASDGIAHEARINAGLEMLFDARVPAGGSGAVWVAPHEGMFSLRCAAHPDALATIAVSAQPFFAVTGTDGSFRIADVPPGSYTLSAWHEQGGEKSADVVVTAGRASEVRFSYQSDLPLVAASAEGPAVANVAIAPPPPPEEPAPPAAEPPPAPAPPANEPCKLAIADLSPVAQACAAGGVGRAAAVMKEIVRSARGRGIRLRCDNCHSDPTTHALVPDAREQLNRLLLADMPVVVVPLAQSVAAAHERPAVTDRRRVTGR